MKMHRLWERQGCSSDVHLYVISFRCEFTENIADNTPEHAEEVIAISKSFNIDAQIVGRIEESDKKELIIKSEFGEFRY